MLDEDDNIKYGCAPFWHANSVSVESRGEVMIQPVEIGDGYAARNYSRLMEYDEGRNLFNFILNNAAYVDENRIINNYGVPSYVIQ